MLKFFTKKLDTINANMQESNEMLAKHVMEVNEKLDKLAEKREKGVEIDVKSDMDKDLAKELKALAVSPHMSSVTKLYEVYKNKYAQQAFSIYNPEKYQELLQGFLHIGTFVEAMKDFDPKYREEKIEKMKKEKK